MKEKKIEKLVLLFTIVSHAKRNLFADFLEEQGINAQLMINGNGMHEKKFYNSLNYKKKAVILSFVGEDKVKTVIKNLQNKFETVKYSYGACWTVPLTSIIGVQAYKFLVDYRKGGIQ